MMMTSTRNVADREVRFVWHGGPYIELGWIGHQPVEVINVWDYERSEPTIPVTRPAFQRTVTDWIEDYGKAELARDLREHYGYFH